MDVLVVTSLYPPHCYGGYETSCQDVVARWRAAGHRVVVLTTTTRVAGAVDDPAERDVRRELGWYWEDHRLPPVGWRARVALERRNAAVLRRTLDDVRPDVVSAWAMGAMSLGLLTAVAERGLPQVLVVCDDWLGYGERVDRWRRSFAGRPRLARAGRALTGLPTQWPPASSATAAYNSAAVRAAAERARWRPAVGAVVEPGIDPVDFPVPDAVPERPWRGRLLQVGRLDPRKGLDDAVRAVATLPGTSLDVVGRGDDAYAARLRALAGELGAAHRVELRGPVPRAALADVYAGADAVLFPVTWAEPFGLVPLEAMACGTPVVATGTGGSATFLADGANCLLVPPRDPAALAAAVRRLAADPDLRRRLVAGGLATARRHSADEYAERLERLHLQAAGALR